METEPFEEGGGAQLICRAHGRDNRHQASEHAFDKSGEDPAAAMRLYNPGVSQFEDLVLAIVTPRLIGFGEQEPDDPAGLVDCDPGLARARAIPDQRVERLLAFERLGLHRDLGRNLERMPCPMVVIDWLFVTRSGHEYWFQP